MRNIKKAMAGEAVQMALSKNWLRDFERWEEDDPMALLGDVASVGLSLWDMWGQYKAKVASTLAPHVVSLPPAPRAVGAQEPGWLLPRRAGQRGPGLGRRGGHHGLRQRPDLGGRPKRPRPVRPPRRRRVVGRGGGR